MKNNINTDVYLSLTSAVGLPRFLIDNAERFRFLLPGGCRRDG
jgi:beta-1,4-mannosyl-glycoprotein beta-1,4-N-acetylglucosaminyltransferase